MAEIEELRKRRDYSDSLWDITDVLAAAVTGTSEDEFLSVRGDRRRFAYDETEEDSETEDESIARRKLAAIVQTFDVEQLRRRRWLKATSKSPVFVGVEWESGIKNADSSDHPGDGATAYGTVRLLAAPTQPAGVFGGYDGPITVSVLTDLEDVRMMIDALRALELTLSTQGNEA
jgi:hypothetical protein